MRSTDALLRDLLKFLTSMKKSILVTAIGFVLLCTSIMYVSCQKSSPDKPGTTTGSSKSLASLPPMSFTPPTVTDGMLKFTDQAQYDQYEAYLQAVIEDNTDSTKGANEVLQDVETGLGHTSLRRNTFLAYEAANATGWASVEEIPEEDWVTSITERSILNGQRRFRIGDEIIQFVTPTYIANIEAGHPDILTKLSALPVTASILDILNCDPTRFYLGVVSTVDNEEHRPTGAVGSGGGITVPWTTWIMQGTAVVLNHCTNPLQVKLTGLHLLHVPTSTAQQGFYTIDWGESLPTPQTATSAFGNNNSLLADIHHIYAAPGTYTITVNVKSLFPIASVGDVKTRTFTVEVDAGDCINTGQMQTQDYYVSPTQVIRGHVKYHHWTKFPGGQKRCKITAYTQYLVKTGSVWKYISNAQTWLCTGVQAMTLNKDCMETGGVRRYNCGRKTNTQYSEYETLRYHWKIVTSRHEVDNGVDTWGFDQNMLAPCD